MSSIGTAKSHFRLHLGVGMFEKDVVHIESPFLPATVGSSLELVQPRSDPENRLFLKRTHGMMKETSERAFMCSLRDKVLDRL